MSLTDFKYIYSLSERNIKIAYNNFFLLYFKHGNDVKTNYDNLKEKYSNKDIVFEYPENANMTSIAFKKLLKRNISNYIEDNKIIEIKDTENESIKRKILKFKNDLNDHDKEYLLDIMKKNECEFRKIIKNYLFKLKLTGYGLEKYTEKIYQGYNEGKEINVSYFTRNIMLNEVKDIPYLIGLNDETDKYDYLIKSFNSKYFGINKYNLEKYFPSYSDNFKSDNVEQRSNINNGILYIHPIESSSVNELKLYYKSIFLLESNAINVNNKIKLLSTDETNVNKSALELARKEFKLFINGNDIKLLNSINDNTIKGNVIVDEISDVASNIDKNLVHIGKDMTNILDSADKELRKIRRDTTNLDVNIVKIGQDLSVMNSNIIHSGTKTDATNQELNVIGAKINATNHDLANIDVNLVKIGQDLNVINNNIGNGGIKTDVTNYELHGIRSDTVNMDANIAKIGRDLHTINGNIAHSGGKVDVTNSILANTAEDTTDIRDSSYKSVEILDHLNRNLKSIDEKMRLNNEFLVAINETLKSKNSQPIEIKNNEINIPDAFGGGKTNYTYLKNDAEETIEEKFERIIRNEVLIGGFKIKFKDIADSILQEEFENNRDNEIGEIIKKEVIDYEKLFALYDDLSSLVYKKDYEKLIKSKNYSSSIVNAFLYDDKIKLQELIKKSKSKSNEIIFNTDRIFLYKLMNNIRSKNESGMEECIKIFVDRSTKYYSEKDKVNLEKLNNLMINLMLLDVNLDNYIDEMDLFFTNSELIAYNLDFNFAESSFKKPLFYNMNKYINIFDKLATNLKNDKSIFF